MLFIVLASSSSTFNKNEICDFATFSSGNVSRQYISSIYSSGSKSQWKCSESNILLFVFWNFLSWNVLKCNLRGTLHVNFQPEVKFIPGWIQLYLWSKLSSWLHAEMSWNFSPKVVSTLHGGKVGPRDTSTPGTSGTPGSPGGPSNLGNPLEPLDVMREKDFSGTTISFVCLRDYSFLIIKIP